MPDHDELGAVQQTLFIPLAARARDGRKKRALLRDPKAADILASADFDQAKYGPGSGGFITCRRPLQPEFRVLPDQAERWACDVVGPGSRIVAARRLRLGGWHVNHAVDVADLSGRVHRLVVRRWARQGWETDDPDYTVEREARVIGLLAATSVPAPEVVAADPAGERCDVPAIILSRLPGHPPSPADAAATGFCAQLAETLAKIHEAGGTAGTSLDSYRLYYDRARATPARWMTSAVWDQATAVVREAAPPAAMTLIHRDYHPENTLWLRGRLTGVVDWTQASWGPAELDVGHMRWNLLAGYGQAAADQFLSCYRAASGRQLRNQSYWDLVSLLDLLLDIADPGDLGPHGLRLFEAYARRALSDQNHRRE